MAEQKRERDEQHILLEDVETDYFDTAGEEDTTIWDNMVQALKPDLTPKRKGH
ncbi:MAG: hypothetical protein ACXVP5_10560 [Tumebacillaceae bacterium]